MKTHLHFSLLPEALIASNPTPERFGQHYSTGHRHKSKGQATFFEVDPAFRHAAFTMDEALEPCAPHPDGTPKHGSDLAFYPVPSHEVLRAEHGAWWRSTNL